MVAHEKLLQCLEDVLFGMPDDKVVTLDIPGIRGRISPFSMPYLNMAGVSPGTTTITADTVCAVRDRFRQEQKSFGWLHTPAAPDVVPELLLAAGFVKAESFAGLICEDLTQEIVPAADMRIEEIGPEERDRFVHLHGSRLGMPAEAMGFMADALYFNPNSPERWRNYFCYVDGVEEPISSASMKYFSGAPVAYLAGAVTDPNYRGRGAYTSLLARRFADAQADGIEAVVIQAVRSTSAPICAKRGFREIVGHDLYVWSAE